MKFLALTSLLVTSGFAFGSEFNCKNDDVSLSLKPVTDFKYELSLENGESTEVYSSIGLLGQGQDATFQLENGQGSLIIDGRGVGELVIKDQSYFNLVCEKI